ncbi:replication restart helicase PriA [Desulfothermobacter acidiphilus]|uniref:replication restart helicase PriA n=1 Tax=Desulfothermobacter acidiphilus TaxID=1938353 RepID=UPI003F8AAD4A
MDEVKGPVAQVAVALPLPAGRQVFSYLIPSELEGRVAPGVQVTVPFRGRSVAGVVVEVSASSPPGVTEFRDLLQVQSHSPLPPELLDLGRWVARRYLCSLGEALLAMTPPREGQEGGYFPAEGLEGEKVLAGPVSRSPAQLRALAMVLAFPGIDAFTLRREASVTLATLRALERKGLIYREETRKAVFPRAPDLATGPLLTAAQRGALARVEQALEHRRPSFFLLHGVTGSGKTEVYLQATLRALERGLQALVLVPEILLAHQLVEQFRSRLGDRVALLHSALGKQERGATWQRVRDGAATVVIGARSAVFAPLTRLGLVVLDEEHEPAYKQEQAPRYHAREVALARAARAGAVVLLGSATPSLETYARALTGRYELLQLPQRAEGDLPRVELVDLRREYRRGQPGLFSRRLLQRIKEKLAAQEQIILFLNRRGFAPFVLCPFCGCILRCPHCDIPLVFHQPDQLLCHYCFYRIRLSCLLCPRCGQGELSFLGAGTQRLEAEVKEKFPQARVVRLDAEATSRRGSHADILAAVLRREVDILIGTQMVAKGLDIPGVTLVGVINADLTLTLPDFRAAERTFQLLYQVAGRAGRGARPGEVIFQSHCPEHYAVRLSARQDYAAFAHRELLLRRRFGYPPFAHLARVVISGPWENRVQEGARWVREWLGAEAGEKVEILGPAPCPLAKLKGLWRWHIILKGRKIKSLLQSLGTVWERQRHRALSGLKVTIDVDPLSML